MYKFFFSSDKNISNPSAAVQAQAKARANPRNSTEHHGVGFVIGPKLSNFVSDCIPHNGRIIELHIRNHWPNIRALSTIIPPIVLDHLPKKIITGTCSRVSPKHKPPTCLLLWWETPTHAYMEESTRWKKRYCSVWLGKLVCG